MDFRSQVEYRQQPGDKNLNYVRARAVTADGAGLAAGLTFSWPGGAVRCPGDRAPKEDGWCEFTATVGEFAVALDGRAQPVTVTLPQDDAAYGGARRLPEAVVRQSGTGVRGQVVGGLTPDLPDS